MFTDAELDANIARLEAALLRPERSTKYADREVVLNTYAEMRSRLAYFQNQKSRRRRRARQFVGVASKGLD